MEETGKIKEHWLQFAKPVQCHLWQKEALTKEDFAFETVRTFADESHFERAVIRCAQCGQHYFYEWIEEVDWDGGNDKMYNTFIPIPLDENIIDTLNQKSSFDLLMVGPRLQWDNGGEIKWIK